MRPPGVARALSDGPAPCYGGRCVTCGGAHSLRPDRAALAAAAALERRITRTGRLDFEAPGLGDPRFSTAYLDGSKGPGRMLGVLVAHDPGSGARRTLKAFSGQITEEWHIPGWAGPVQGVTSAGSYYAAVRAATEDLTRRIERLRGLQRREADVAAAAAAAAAAAGGAARAGHPNQGGRRGGARGSPAVDCQQQGASARFVSCQLELLTERRRHVSHHLLEQVQRSYKTFDCSGAPLCLCETYAAYRAGFDPGLPVTRAGAFEGFPAGCGDCCAPKLLHAAASAGLVPVSMVEFWYGSPPRTATKAKPPAKARLGPGGRAGGGGSAPGGPGAAEAQPPSRRHGQVYGMCPKCEAILGTMLHPLHAADTCDAGDAFPAGLSISEF